MITLPNQEPLWIITLRQQCEFRTQKSVGKDIGYTAAVVNQVLQGKYKGDVAKVEAAVRGAFMGATVKCPVLGELPTHNCLAYQKRPFAATNPTRVQLYRACRGTCPYGTGGAK